MKTEFRSTPGSTQDSGFAIGMILLVVVLLTAVVAVVASGSGASGNISAKQRNNMLASNLMSQASDMNSAILGAQKNGFPFDKILAQESGCDFDEFCLFDPTTGLTEMDTPNGSTTEASTWATNTFRLRFTNDGDVGTSAEDFAIVLANVTPEVCRYVNISTNDFPYDYDDADFRESTGNDLTAPATATVTITGDLSDYHPVGCTLGNGGDTYYFYRIVEGN